MNNSEFYNSIKLIASQKGTTALVNIHEFKRLQKIRGDYKWQPFEIGMLRAIPVTTSDFKETFRATDEIVNIRLMPIWTFFTNGERIITPKIEIFELTEHSKSQIIKKRHYSLSKHQDINPNYLSNSTWENIFDKRPAQRQNAVEWQKRGKSILLTPINEKNLQTFLNVYKDELAEFNKIYEESAKTAKELNQYQKRLK